MPRSMPVFVSVSMSVFMFTFKFISMCDFDMILSAEKFGEMDMYGMEMGTQGS
jgi:hypothetical protein